MLNKVHIIFTGFNQRALIAFLRTLKETEQPYALIAKAKSDSIFLTEYKSRVFSIRNKVELDLNDIIRCIYEIKQKIPAKEYIIAPSTEALNRFILKHHQKFNEIKCIIPLVNKNLYELISDKHKFNKLCLENGIEVPNNYKSFDLAEIPFVAKPYNYFSSDGNTYSPYLILNEKDKIHFKQSYNIDDFFYQKFVTGKSLYLLYYFHRNGKVYKYSQENIVQQPNGKSIVAAISSNFHFSDESLKYEHLLKKMNYHGFIMIEVKQDGISNYMIEANPRFWGPSQLFVDAKMNFFECYIHDYGDLKVNPEFIDDNKPIKYFWFGGLIESYKNEKNPVFHKENEKAFLIETADWLQCDIYKRADTINIFKTEIK